MTIFQYFEVAATVAADIEGFIGGQTVTVPVKNIGGYNVTLSSQILPEGPTPQFPAITSIAAVLPLAFEAIGGVPVTLAEKIGSTWLGHTITVVKA